MGLCVSNEDAKANQEINRQINRDRRKFNEQIRLLLLGSGESGKSTVFKQMKIIQLNGGFSDEERKGYKTLVFRNCISEMKVLTNHAIKLNKISKDKEVKAITFLEEVSGDGSLWNSDIAETVKELWKDESLKEIFHSRAGNLQINDTADYFFDNIDKFMDPNYIPDDEDILRARVRSTGIEEAEFKFYDMSFKMVDVGGQRSERRKWIHCFQDVNAILFCASLSEYDQTLREDPDTNRMHESLRLFEEVSSSRWFKNTHIILFLNKLDLFEKKISRVPLQKLFPNYIGGDDKTKALEFIRARYSERMLHLDLLFIHETIAVDTENMRFVFGAVRRTILEKIIDTLPIL